MRRSMIRKMPSREVRNGENHAAMGRILGLLKGAPAGTEETMKTRVDFCAGSAIAGSKERQI